jgi:hypothetical protein
MVLRSSPRPRVHRAAPVLGPTRPVPRVGAKVHVKHFGGGQEAGAIVAVYDEGRRVQVYGEDEQLYEFVLNPATARFASARDPHGPQLKLLDEPR